MECINVRKVLMKIGISAHLQGHHYILEAVNIIGEQKIHTSMITIYEMIAKSYGTSNGAVERAIRHSIQQAYKNSYVLKEIYETLPDNSAFLYDLVFNLDVFENKIREV